VVIGGATVVTDGAAEAVDPMLAAAQDVIPRTIFRTGSRTEGALTDPSGVSFRSSVSSSADGQQIVSDSEVEVSSAVRSPMSKQLREHEVLARRLAGDWRQVVILERLARGGGGARWFFATSLETLEQVFDLFRGGSSVSFYFSRYLHVRVDQEESRQDIFDEVIQYGEVVLGYPSRDDLEFEMVIISGPSELTESLMHHPEGALAIWGQWPPRENDGHDVITIDLVDADGVLRSHPH